MRHFPKEKFLSKISSFFQKKMFCAFWALDIAPTWDVPVLFASSSAISFPFNSECPGTHWTQIDFLLLSRSFLSSSASRVCDSRVVQRDWLSVQMSVSLPWGWCFSRISRHDCLSFVVGWSDDPVSLSDYSDNFWCEGATPGENGCVPSVCFTGSGWSICVDS